MIDSGQGCGHDQILVESLWEFPYKLESFVRFLDLSVVTKMENECNKKPDCHHLKRRLGEL